MSLSENNPSKLSISQIALKGTIIAVIITVPSIAAFVIAWSILDNVWYAIVLGGVVHFIAMGFSLKISKKILVKK